MIQEKIKTTLIDWFIKMVNDYPWLSIKFEYSQWHRCYLVSYCFDSNIVKVDDFYYDAMVFEDNIVNEYIDKAPLFCDNEKYFKLSKNANVININNWHEYKIE